MNRHAVLKLRSGLLLLGVTLALGCPQPPTEPDGGTGGTGGTNSDGGGGCTPGEVGCTCGAQDACNGGVCTGGQCTACTSGALNCTCMMNGTCGSGLRCDNNRCVSCTAGTSGCPCGTGDTCNSGLVCMSGTCVANTCVNGQNGCPCNATDPRCTASTSYCDMSGRCQACSPDIVGCACGPSSTCNGGLVCGSDTKCRQPVTCSTLTMDGGTCRPNQLCSEADGGMDAVCVADTCVANFKWDPVNMRCVACASSGCTNEPRCTDDGGISAMCSSQHRLCVQSGQVASCGACEAGFSDTGTACVARPRCGMNTCADMEYCDSSTGTPTCRALPCPAGQAKDGPNGTCGVCNRTCMGEGFSGRIWPFKTNQGVCVCETLDGYYFPVGMTSLAAKCDADNDGWVREEADDQTTRNDPALKANARCTIRAVDRVRLVDEFGTAAEVLSCTSALTLSLPSERRQDGGIIPAADAGCGGNFLPLRLLETQRNDVAGPLMDLRAPAYGGDAGRLLEAREVNSLTKACVSDVGDFNNNNVDDVAENQAAKTDRTPIETWEADRVRLHQFAFFTELYSSWYEPPTSGTNGTLVIRERSRCNGANFPIRYETAANINPTYVSNDAGTTYWRNCDRRRDPAFNLAIPAPNMDFAQWACAGTSGSCPWQQPAHRIWVSPTDPRNVLLRDFGVCELAGTPPADGRWRGMLHHSQFKCVKVTTSPTTAYDQRPEAFASAAAADGGLLYFNACVAAQCTGDAGCRITPGASTGLPQTDEPTINCRAQLGPTGGVGFAAVGFRPYGVGEGYTVSDPPQYGAGGTYASGCITEDTESALTTGTKRSYICPYPEFSMVRTRSDATWGRHTCYGRPSNFLWCGTPCVPERATLRWSGPTVNPVNGVLR